MLDIQLLGDLRITAAGVPLMTVQSARLQSLLAYLLVHRGAPQSRQQMAYRFWADSSDTQARTNLRNALFQLRNALPDADAYLHVDTQSIQWRIDAPYRLDLAEFEAALTSAAQAVTATAKRTALESALQHYGGDLLPGCYDDWVFPERERLQQALLQALDELIALLEGQQEYRSAIEWAGRLLLRDPLRESTYCKLMQLHALAGDRAAALRVYHTCTTTLARELAVEPDPTTRRVYEHLLNLEAPQPSVTPMRDLAPLVGRAEAWTQLQECWRQASRGHPSVVLLAGEPGIGKTRLAEELVDWAQRQGIAAAIAHCYAVGGNLALSPVQEWLRAPILRRARQELEPLWASEVARLLPELLIDRPGLAAPAPLLETWQRQRMFEALARLLFHRNEPLLLLLDDIQWCDGDTLEWIQYLVRTYPKARLLIVVTMRQGELTPNHFLMPLLQQLSRAGQLSQIELARLNPAETTQLAANLLGQPLTATLAEHVFDETEGNPLFVVEMVRATVRTARPAADESRPTAEPLNGGTPVQSLPPRVLAVIQSRLDHLSPHGRDLACVAAVVGRAFTVDVLAGASELSEDDLVRGLDELWQQRMIREQRTASSQTEAYDFTHDKLREVAYASLSPMFRRLLHKRVAQALEAVHAANPEPVYPQIAVQYERARLLPAAISAYQRAAQVAHQRSAFTEAIGHLTHALTLLAALPPNAQQDQQELALQAALGPLLLATKGYAAPEVEGAFTRAWELCQQRGDQRQQFQVLWGLGRFYFVQPNPTRGLEVSQQLLALAHAAADEGLLMEALCSLGTHYFHRAAFAEARRYLEETLALYERDRHRDHALIYGQDPGVVACAYLAWTLWCLGETRAALAQTATGLALAEELGDPYSQVIILTYASVQQHFLDNPDTCRSYAEAAIGLADKHGFALWLSMATFLRGWAQTQQGQVEGGFADMQQGIDLFRNTGADLGAAYFTALLADTFGRTGQPDVGLLLMPAAFDLGERAQDHWSQAELYRLQGELHLRQGERAEAITAFEAALTTAQTQDAHQWALRAALRLAQLAQPAAMTTLTALVQRFPNEVPTPDLAQAKALLANDGAGV
jgi:predicted ATPase/DNA-binding SARP family transcriptional activator